jgi:hypothetical protein
MQMNKVNEAGDLVIAKESADYSYLFGRNSQYEVRAYIGDETYNIINNVGGIGDQVSEVYVRSFSDGKYWNESWTPQKASAEINQALLWDNQKRIPVAALLIYHGDDPEMAHLKEKVIGLSWGVLLENLEALDQKRDFPFSLPKNSKKFGKKLFTAWARNFYQEERVLVYREVAVHPDARKKGNPFIAHLAYPIVGRAWELGYPVLMYWTNRKSPSVGLGLGLGWLPIYFWGDPADHLLIAGHTKPSSETMLTCLDKDKSVVKAGWETVISRAIDFSERHPQPK